MFTHHLSRRHAKDDSREELPLLLYAVVSALLPYAAAAALILFGQTF